MSGSEKVLGALLFAVLAFGVIGCNQPNGGCIGDEDLTCVELVTDECVPEVIEEFCTDCDLDAAYNEGYNDGRDSVVCDDDDSDECEEPSYEAICKRLPYGIRKKQPECKWRK